VNERRDSADLDHLIMAIGVVEVFPAKTESDARLNDISVKYANRRLPFQVSLKPDTEVALRWAISDRHVHKYNVVQLRELFLDDRSS